VTRTPRRAVAAAALLALAALVLAGCGAGVHANTATPYSPTNGAFTTVGDVAISNLIVISDPSGDEILGQLAGTGSTPDQLTSISVANAGPIDLPGGPIMVPARGAVQLGGSGTPIPVEALTVAPGRLVTVTLDFQVAGTVTVSTMVSTLANLTAGD
jgi:hypothetical protein